MEKILQFYKIPDMITDLSKYSISLKKITNNPEYISRIASGLFIHDSSTTFFNVPYCEEKLFHPLLMSDLLEEIMKIDDDYLTKVRDANKRLLVCCREYSVFTVALLRAKNIPARSRCVFPLYLNVAESLVEHWIVEYWNGIRWVATDPMIDPMFLSALERKGIIKVNGIDKGTISNYGFPNPNDLDKKEYISTGEAWKYLRENKVVNKQFSYLGLNGKYYVRIQLLRDFLAINKFEFQTHFSLINQGYNWKCWRLIDIGNEELTRQDILLLDKIAELTLDIDSNFENIRDLYESTPQLHMPKELINIGKKGSLTGQPQQVLLEILQEDQRIKS